jgi:amino acid transporter
VPHRTLSPLVGVYSLFAYSLSLGGPPAIWWIVIVGCGQMLVALVFGEVVSQYPLAGGIYALPVCLLAARLPGQGHCVRGARYLYRLPAVVLAALRQRLRGWRPAGLWNLGSAGMAVNVAALAYGIFAMFLLARPGEGDTFLDRWIVIIGAILVFITGLAYMLIAKPYDRSEGVPEGDAVQVAAQLRSLREQSPAG